MSAESKGGAGRFARWLSPEGYLGAHLAVGFALALGTGLLFDLIEDEVFEAPATLAADLSAQSIAAHIASPTMTSLMLFASWVGNPSTVTVLTLAVAVVLFLKKSHRRLYAFLATMIGGSLLNMLLKAYYHRSRPSEIVPLTVAHGYSFPSGHSMGSMLFFGSLAYVIFFSIEGHRWWRVAAVALCALTVMVIGGSRIYLGVHYFSDVIAGFTAGLCWIAVCLTGTEGWVRWRDRRRIAFTQERRGADAG